MSPTHRAVDVVRNRCLALHHRRNFYRAASFTDGWRSIYVDPEHDAFSISVRCRVKGRMTNKAGWTGFDTGSGVWDGRDNPRLWALVAVSKYVLDDDLEVRRRFELRVVLPGGELDARPCCTISGSREPDG